MTPHDTELAQRALEKRGRGETPTRDELRGLRRYQAGREKEDRWKHYGTVPKTHYAEMAGGRTTKVLHEQSDRHGLELRGSTVDLRKVIRRFHDLLAENQHRLAVTSGDDPMSGLTSPALELWRNEQYHLARLKRQEMEKQLADVNELHDLLSQLAVRLRSCGEQLERQHGSDAHALLDDALGDMLHEIEVNFGAVTDAGSKPPKKTKRRPRRSA